MRVESPCCGSWFVSVVPVPRSHCRVDWDKIVIVDGASLTVLLLIFGIGCRRSTGVVLVPVNIANKAQAESSSQNHPWGQYSPSTAAS